MMFADAQPGAPEIGMWVLIAILVINGLGAVGGLVAIFATRREVEAIAARVTASEEQREVDLQQGSERRAKIYGELRVQREDFQREVKSVYARIERSEEIHNDIMRKLPNEILSTLKHSGAIK